MDPDDGALIEGVLLQTVALLSLSKDAVDDPERAGSAAAKSWYPTFDKSLTCHSLQDAAKG